MPDGEERLPGVLTRGDQEYLRGEKQYQSPEAEINKRRNIRRRILNGVLDFDLIQRNFLPKDRRKLFNEAADDEDRRQEFVQAVQALLSWIYIGLKEGRFDAKRIFEAAIKIGEAEVGFAESAKIVQSDVNLSIRTREIERIQPTIRKLERGDPVEAYQLYPLVQNGVGIDFSGVDTVRIFASTNRRDGERAILETMFAEYFDADVEVEVIFPDNPEKS